MGRKKGKEREKKRKETVNLIRYLGRAACVSLLKFEL